MSATFGTAVKRKPAWNGRLLRKADFDRSEYNRAEGTYKVRCSQCAAMVINGHPCHERGCPNVRTSQ